MQSASVRDTTGIVSGASEEESTPFIQCVPIWNMLRSIIFLPLRSHRCGTVRLTGFPTASLSRWPSSRGGINVGVRRAAHIRCGYATSRSQQIVYGRSRSRDWVNVMGKLVPAIPSYPTSTPAVMILLKKHSTRLSARYRCRPNHIGLCPAVERGPKRFAH